MDAAFLFKSGVLLIGFMSPVIFIFVVTSYAGELLKLLRATVTVFKKRRYF